MKYFLFTASSFENLYRFKKKTGRVSMSPK